MKNRLNCWRKPITSVPRHKLLTCKVLITRAATGWRWRVMRDTDQLDSGMERTKDGAIDAGAAAKKMVMGTTQKLKAITI